MLKGLRGFLEDLRKWGECVVLDNGAVSVFWVNSQTLSRITGRIAAEVEE